MAFVTATEVDGRRARRQQNRDAVVEALLASFAEGVYQPSTAEVADRAGLSPRSLFRYFDDVNDLARAAIERQLEAARPLFGIEVAPDAPTGVRIRAAVEARMRLFDAIAPGARAARVCAPANPVVAAELREARTFFRRQLGRLFEPELRARPWALPAVDVLLSFEARELLCGVQRLSTAKATAALVDALTALLEPDGPDGGTT